MPWLPVLSQVLRWRGCVLDVQSRLALILSSGRVLQFNFFFESKASVLQLKVPDVRKLSESQQCVQSVSNSTERHSFYRREDRFGKAHHPYCPVSLCIAGRSGTGERFCSFRYFRSFWGILSWSPAWLKPYHISIFSSTTTTKFLPFLPPPYFRLSLQIVL